MVLSHQYASFFFSQENSTDESAEKDLTKSPTTWVDLCKLCHGPDTPVIEWKYCGERRALCSS